MLPSVTLRLMSDCLLLKRCEYPMVNFRFLASASSMSSSASESEIAIGFSSSTCLPASRHALVIG